MKLKYKIEYLIALIILFIFSVIMYYEYNLIVKYKNYTTFDVILISQIIKYTLGLLVIFIIYMAYRQNKVKTTLLVQLQKVIDKTTLLSKTDLKGRITYVNDAFVELSGFTEEELLGSHHNVVRDPNISKKTFKEMWDTIQSKNVWHGQISNLKKDGEQYVVDSSVIPILDRYDNLKEYISIRHDVTELENYKTILKNKLQDTSSSLKENINHTIQYEEAISNSTAVLKTDVNHIITFANDRFCKLSGYTLDELIGTDSINMRYQSTNIIKDWSDIKVKLLNKKVVHSVFKNVSKSYEKYFLDTVIYPITSMNENIEEYLYIMYDISEMIHLNKEIEETQKEVVFQMGAIGESRSKETGNHVKRVAEYSYLLAILYGLDKKEAELLKQCSPMHDIGKVGIPDSILKKAGKLDANEWKIMQTHTSLGYEMLKHSQRPILKTAAIVANQHHEKWDGSGYPNGLKENEINIYGRITAIADVFDALGSQRVYKEAWKLEKILDLFKEERGKHFEPKLVDLFIDNLDQFLLIRNRFKDIT